jgi:Kef-type K+ transport system membrane component KefB/CBS domain-containing protein
MEGFDWQVWQGTFTLGVLLIAALLVGTMASWLRLPKVTAYLLVGVFLGPGILNWIPHEHIELFKPLTKLAIALVLFQLGCHFPLARLRRTIRRVLRLSVGELALTFLAVVVGIGLVWQQWEMALLLGALALATAPATTILVLQETQSEGPVTEFTNSLVALNNLISIVLFEILFLAIYFAQGRLDVPISVELRLLVQDLAGSVALGVAGGLAVSFAFAQVADSRRLILLMAVIALLLAVCQLAQMPYLLTFLAMGATVVNSSDQTRQVLAELDRLTGLLCVVFFVTHGAELQPVELREAGWIGVAYIVLRFAGKYVGTRVAAVAGREEPAVRRWLGATLLAQAGAAIALSAVAVHRTTPGTALHALCLDVQTIILGTVVVFEIAGPILIRHAVLRAGEVPLAQAVRHSAAGPFDQLQTMANRLLIAMGRDPWRGRPRGEMTVGEIMRKNVQGVPQEATFDEVIERIEHSHDNTYPVVGRAGELVGVIRYRELSDALFDPALEALVLAADLATPARWVLHPDEPVARVQEMFEASGDDCLPVVRREEPYGLVGVVRRRDVLRLLIQGQMDAPAS